MAVADADYRFIDVDIGAYGSEGDSSVFRKSSFGQALMQRKLQLPKSVQLHKKPTPFVFLGDDAFPLHKHLMKPFKPTASDGLSVEQRIFNYR